ncbi:MAG: ACP S-malonyltransferase [Chromatiales bacterium]|jgi:[acyl-carrier-protein] S-malonyltransferase|nr:ACP S-malonyltransferase [Chromatiales bacterium]
MKLGMVFPGQGSQSVGMLAELAASEPCVQATLREASEALGIDLATMMLEGPQASLNRTQNTQPAVLTGAVAMWRVWCERGGDRPELLAGHSVGEFTALVCADALPFAEAVRFVAERGRYMQEAVPEGEGAVAAILGLDDDAVGELCDRAAQGQIVSPVNFNAPGQVVIAGHSEAVERTIGLAKEAGVRKAMVLPVSVPVHCALMREPGERLLPSIDALSLSEPSIPIVHNVDVATHASVDEIRAVLRPHVFSPVPWTRTVQSMAAQGIDTLVECGAGRVLTGLVKRIDKNVTIHPIFDETSVAKAIGAIKG